MKQHVRTTACVLGVMLFAATLSAQAVDVTRQPMQTATGVCNGSLPSYEGALRKRPLGIANEGTSSAFISCATAGNELGLANDAAGLYFTNNGAAPATVNCTFVDGVKFYSSQYRPKSVTLNPGQYAPIIWFPAEYQLTTFSRWANFNCTLPAGVEINEVVIRHPENVGA